MADTTFHSLKLPGQDAARVPSMAEEFTTETNYQVKDYCTYQGKLYRCITAHPAGAWNAAHFIETDIDTEFDRKLDIPASQASAPVNPRVGDLWIDNDENSPIYNVDASPILGSTNAVQSGGTKTALNSLDSRKMEHGVITGDFSASVDYRVGDLVFYATTANGITTRTLYRCTTDHNATAWNAAHFTATTLEVELQKVRDSEADTDMIGDLFGSKSIYNIGDYCIYNTDLYRCIKPVDNTNTNAPGFNSGDWVQIKLANEIYTANNLIRYTNDFIDGDIVLSKNDFESGVWGYTTKINNSKRLRSIHQIPVQAGMQIKYTNPSLELYFGFAPEQNSGSNNFITTGWIPIGKNNATYIIPINGYLQISARIDIDQTDVFIDNYDCDIIIQKNSANYTNKVENGIYPIWEWGAISNVSYQEIADEKGIRSNFIPVATNSILVVNGVEQIRSAGVFGSLMVLMYDQNKEHFSGEFIFTSKRDYVISNVSLKPNTSYIRLVLWSANKLVDGSSKELLSFYNQPMVQELKIKNEHYGVCELDVLYFKNLIYNYEGLFYSPNVATSCIYPIPESGVKIYVDDYCTMNFRFYKIIDNVLIPAADYKLYSTNNQDSFEESSLYLPYEPNVYFSINCALNYYNNIHVIIGKINANGGRMPNLQMCNIYGKRKNGSTNKQNQYLDIFNTWSWARERDDSTDWVSSVNGGYVSTYCSILPLYAVESVTVAPPYTIAARVYKIDNDNKTANIEEEIFGHVIFTSGNIPHRRICGVHHIDFSKYNFEGIVLICIIAPETLINGKAVMQTMGILKYYNDVYNSVFIQWKSGVQVSYDTGIPSVCKKNIDTIKNIISFVDLKAMDSDGGYGNWNVNAENVMKIEIAYGDCCGWWYNGTNMFNGPFMHVNPKSYITASKNKHSRVYVPTHRSASYDKSNNLYGTVCSSTSSLVCGFQVGSETFSYCSEFVDNFDYRELEGIESLRPGDLLACGTFMPDEEAEKGSYGHVIFITEKVSINGEVWCVNTFEGAQPYTQCRTLINYGAYPNYVGSRIHEENNYDIDIFKYFSYQAYVNNYTHHKIARPKPFLLHTFRDAYNIKYDIQDYPVTSIMCDRGTDAVYCIGEYMTLTVTDGTTTFDLYKDNAWIKSVNLSSYNSTTYNDCIVYDVTNMFNSPGYYQIRKNNTVMESWFVPVERYMNATSTPEDNIITLKFDPSEENDKVVCATIEYWNDNDGTGRPVYDWQNIDDTTVDSQNHCTYIGTYAPEFCDNVQRIPISASILRRTPYGTYQVRKFLYASANYRTRQRAGLMIGAEDG